MAHASHPFSTSDVGNRIEEYKQNFEGHCLKNIYIVHF